MYQLPNPILAKIISHLTYKDYIHLWQVPTVPLRLSGKRFQQYLIHEKYGLSHLFSGSIHLIEKFLRAPDPDFNSFFCQNNSAVTNIFKIKKLRQQSLIAYNKRWPALTRDLAQYFTFGTVTYSLIDANYSEPVHIQLPLDLDRENLARIYISLAENKPDVIYRYLITTNNFDFPCITSANEAKRRMINKIFGDKSLRFKYLAHKVKYNRIGIYIYLFNKYCVDFVLYFLLGIVIFVFFGQLLLG